MSTRVLAFVAVIAASFAVVAGCGSSAEGASTSDVPAVCSEASPSEARIPFDQGEIAALAVANGSVYAGARSLRVDEEGAVWRVSFDGAPAQEISRRYVGGAVVVNAGTLLHSEPFDAEPGTVVGRLVVSELAGAERTVVADSRMFFGDFAVARDRAWFFGRNGGDAALWSYDRDAGLVRVTDDVGGGLFSNGDDVFAVRANAAGDRFSVVRFDRASAVFDDIASFPVHARTVAGIDRASLYLHDVATETIRVVDLGSGVETRSLGHDVNETTAGAHLTSDAVYAFESGTARLARIDKATGEQRVVADLGESAFVHAFASDACYVYAAIEGGRTIARVPRQPH